MRMIIKNADFSSVSIGKVTKDLSFVFDTESEGVAAINEFFPNFNSGTLTKATYYAGSEGSNVQAVENSAGRAVSEYHEVSEDMSIVAHRLGCPITTPCIIAFDENKNIVSSACFWQNQVAAATNSTINYTVPSGIKYLKFQINDDIHYDAGATAPTGDRYLKITASMPE